MKRFAIQNVSAREFSKWLRSKGACREARRFCKCKTLKQAWEACDKIVWMSFLLIRCAVISDEAKNAQEEIIVRWLSDPYEEATHLDLMRKHFRVLP